MRFGRVALSSAVALVALGAVASCATLAGLDQDYVAGEVGGAAQGTTTTLTASTSGTAGSGGTGTGSSTTSGTGGVGAIGGSAGSGTGGSGGSPPLSYFDEVMADGPVAYWRLGEAAGPKASDSSGHEHHAEYHGNVGYSVAGAISGDTDTAVHFDGDGADVSHALDFDDFHDRAPYSLEAWFKADSYDGVYRHLFNKDFTGTNGRQNIGLFVQSSELLGFERFVQGEKHQAAAALPVLGAWAHIVGTYDGQMLRLYVDGQLAQEVPDDRMQDPKPVPSFIGAKRPLQQTLYGSLDEFAIYDHALPAGRVSGHFLAGTRP